MRGAPWPSDPPPQSDNSKRWPLAGISGSTVLAKLDKWWAGEKRHLCGYPAAAPQRVFELLRKVVAEAMEDH